jgi:hypothetical protein
LGNDGPVTGPLWAWGEWEAEARALRSLDGGERRPSTLFEPYWEPKNSFENLHNTDPFIFGGFYYTDCKQGSSASLQGILKLDVGSVIIFGSGFNDAGEARWVVDTVFVVADYVDHDVTNYEDRLHNRVPEGYQQVVLGPTYGEHAPRRGNRRRLYIGAKWENPVAGMFSFFPCMAPGLNRGFARPAIKPSGVLTSDYLNTKLRQGMKGHGSVGALALDKVAELWAEVRDQVTSQGCDLGVWAEMPKRGA